MLLYIFVTVKSSPPLYAVYVNSGARISEDVVYKSLAGDYFITF